MIRLVTVFTFSLLALVFCFACQPEVQTTSPYQRVFVNGYVVVPVSTAREKVKNIYLPHARVFLFESQSSTKPISSTLSDLSGRFRLKTDKQGDYKLCVEADGFDRFCKNTINTDSFIRISPKKHNSEDRATVFGTVTLGDGSRPRAFMPFSDVNAYARVSMETGGETKYKGFVNNLGEYIVPSVPTKEDFILRVSIDSEKRVQLIKKETKLLPNRDYPINIQMVNRKPRVHLVSAAIGGKPVQVAAPGNTLTLTVVTSDLDDDKLNYRWELSDGTIVGATNDPKLDWKLPNRRGNYTARVIVSDDRGGYTQSSITIEAANDNRVAFSGRVVDDNDTPIGQAQIDINGRLLNTNGKGRFEIRVPVAERYVMNIRKHGVKQPGDPAYGTGSYVYTGAVNGGRWVLRRAQVSTVDPTKTISLEHKRDKRDCIRPASKKINWDRHLNPGIFQWQDGRGYARSIPEIGQKDPKAVRRVMKILARMNPELPGELAKITKGFSETDYRQMPCRNGVKVEIPPNSLIDPSTGLEPAGDVQVALSTVDLSVPQMPGDYSADNGSGRLLGMESFGAASVEIGAGNSRYNLKPDTVAKVSIPVDATQMVGGAGLKNTIPFLYYNETKGIWEQEGKAKLSVTPAGGAVYVNDKVKHFSAMNADILKEGQSCVAVEVDPAAGFTLPFNAEVTLQPSVVNPDVIQVRTLVVDSLKSNVIYNLPNASDIVITPIVQGVRPDGSAGLVPAGVFVVNTGGPQTSASNVPVQNPDGSYYSEAGGEPAGPCGSRVTLTFLNGPVPSAGYEFLQGLSFQSSNINEFADAVAANIVQGATDYYIQADPRGLRASFNLFKSKNKFGDALNAAEGEVEHDAQFANSGDLGFGRDMHCRRNRADDGEFDLACYVTNYGQPPLNLVDQVDADNAFNNNNPDATVAMEFSRVENPPGDPVEFPDNFRAVKFFVYGADPDAEPVKQADLDGFGDRPIPQLCMVCHGGNLASLAADPLNPDGPKKGAFAERADIMNMNSNFLPFDLGLYTFPAANSKAAQEAAFKGLNIDIVKEVAVGTGVHGIAINALVDAFYAGGVADQVEKPVVPSWDDLANPAADSIKLYKNVVGPACRTCHISRPFGAPGLASKFDFHDSIEDIQTRVCLERIMPHAKRTNEIFWTSLDPNMPAFLELYGQTVPGWAEQIALKQCGQHYEPGGNIALSEFSGQIFPILSGQCSTCHGAVGNANFVVSTAQATYDSILNATARDGSSKYIVPNDPGNSVIYQRITTAAGRMPQGGANLEVTDTDNPPDGINDALEILNWINGGASGP